MTWSSIPLQSLDLAQYSMQVSCYVCDGGNRFDAEFCRHCRAPLALAYQARKQKAPPQMLAVLGGPGVGKTCYVGMLTDMLSRQTGGLQMLAHGAFSVSLQQQTISALARRRFPPPTPPAPEGWRWVHCDVRAPNRKRSLELVVPDVAGSAILDEIEAPQRSPVIRRMLGKSAAAMILLEVSDDENAEQQPEFVALKIASELLNMPAAKRKGWASRPVAIVFTKADVCDWAIEKPEEYARHHASGLWRLCHDQFQCYRFFATSIATAFTGIDGFKDSITIPMRVEPRGVIEPFAWISEQLMR